MDCKQHLSGNSSVTALLKVLQVRLGLVVTDAPDVVQCDELSCRPEIAGLHAGHSLVDGRLIEAVLVVVGEVSYSGCAHQTQPQTGSNYKAHGSAPNS